MITRKNEDLDQYWPINVVTEIKDYGIAVSLTVHKEISNAELTSNCTTLSDSEIETRHTEEAITRKYITAEKWNENEVENEEKEYKEKKDEENKEKKDGTKGKNIIIKIITDKKKEQNEKLTISEEDFDLWETRNRDTSNQAEERKKDEKEELDDTSDEDEEGNKKRKTRRVNEANCNSKQENTESESESESESEHDENDEEDEEEEEEKNKMIKENDPNWSPKAARKRKYRRNKKQN